jgi:ABC-type molybdate transport system ATPase subunit
MKSVEQYIDIHTNALLKSVKERLVTGPVKISVDTEINSVEDLEKRSILFALKRLARKTAILEYKKHSRPEILLITPVLGSMQNGVELEEGIVVPVYAPRILNPSEYTDRMMVIGLVMMLKDYRDEYYLKLLRSFNLERRSVVVTAMVEDKYWDKHGKRLQKYDKM